METPSLPPPALPLDSLESNGSTAAATRTKSIVKFTPRGIRYEVNDDEDATNEHKREKLPMLLSLDEIEARFGPGTRAYFDFLKFIIISNLVLFSLCFINWSLFMSSEDSSRTVMCNFPNSQWTWREGCESCTILSCPNATGVTRTLAFWEKWYVSSYSHNQRVPWYVLNVLCIVWWFASGPVYYCIMRFLHKPTEESESDNPFNFSGQEGDKITENEKITHFSRIVRRIISYSIFVGLITISATAIYFIQWWGTDSFVKTNFWLSLLVSFIIAVINLIWSILCIFLTEFEKHTTWSAHRKHSVAKVWLFKICNVTIMWIALRWAFAQQYSCPLQDQGVKMALQILLDLFVMNVVEFTAPFIKTLLYRYTCCRKISTGSDEEELPEFDVSDEYLELLYRQFVMFLGMLVFPMITFVSLITNIIEYPLDKVRMLKICQRPKRLNSRLTGFIVFFMFLTALAAFFSYPAGGLWMLLGGQMENVGSNCGLWQKTPSSLP